MSVRSFRSSRRWAFFRYGAGACLFVSLLFGAVVTPEAWAATYFVNAATGNNANTAAQAMNAATPWLTITRAITEATLTPGDTINVAAGTYDTSLGETMPLFLVNGVAIIGAGAPATSIFNVGTIFQNTNTPLSAATRLSGVELQAKGGVGMRFELSSVAMAPRIDNVVFTDTLGAGIQVVESTAGNSSFTALIENNTFDVDINNMSILQNGGGAGDVYSPTIRNNTFTPNGVSGFGIQLTQSGQASGIMAPTITGNTFTGPFIGIQYSGDGLSGTSATFAAVISNNTFTPTFEAIVLSGGNIDLASNGETYTFSPTITNNTITGGTGEGMSISLSFLQTGHFVSNMLISGNTITDAGGDGMSLSISELSGGNGVDINWTVSNNTITNPGSDGISLDVSSLTGGGTPGTFCVTLSGNTITSAGADGMSVSISPGSSAVIAQNILIVGNTITGSGSNGISLSLSSQTLITTNNIEIRNNVLSNNGTNGLEIASSSFGANAILVSCNTITGNGSNGIEQSTGTDPPADYGGGNRGSPGNNTLTGNKSFDFRNNDESPVKAENNWWGTTVPATIDGRIFDDDENALSGAVDFDPFRTTAPLPADCTATGTTCGGVAPTPTPTPTGQPPPTATPTRTATPTTTPVSGVPAVVPTLGGWMMFLFAALLAVVGLLVGRRGALFVVLLLLFLAPHPTLAATPAARKQHAVKIQLATLQKDGSTAAIATFRLSDGTVVAVPRTAIKFEDRRFQVKKSERSAIGTTAADREGRRDARHKAKAAERALRLETLPAGQPMVLKIRYRSDGSVKKAKVLLYRNASAAREALQRLEKRKEKRAISR